MFLGEIIYFFLNVWLSCNFFYIPKLLLTLFFIYTDMTIVLVVVKNGYSVKDSFSF